MAATFIGIGITPDPAGVIGHFDGQSFPGHNDFTLTADGNLRMVYDAEAVGEHARQRLNFYRGEWPLDPVVGVDWFGQVLGARDTRVQVAEAIIKRTILQTPGVTALLDVQTTYSRADRGVKVERCVVQTQFDQDAVI